LSKTRKLDPERSIRRHARIGLLALLLLLFGVGGWSALASIQGAVIAAGTVVVETSKKRVQHAEGGIVAEIHITDGDQVEAGDVLFDLDGTRIRAEQQILDGRRFDAEVRKERLLAEVDGRARLTLPPELEAKAKAYSEFAAMVQVQADLLRSRLAMGVHQDDQHEEQIKRLKAELEGLEHQKAGRQKELKLISTEIKAIETLTGKGLALRQGLNNLRRQDADVRAELGRLATAMASAEGQIKELVIKRADLKSRFENDALTQLEETTRRLSDLRAQQLATEDRLRRLHIRAPRSGLVHELAVHTEGAVIAPGDTLMNIVPVSDALIIEANIRTMDVDQVAVGQTAQIRFPAFNTRTTPTLKAKVRSVSADQSVDEKTGEPYYTVRLTLLDDEAERIEDGKITPGMPTEVMVTSDERTVLSYLMKPLSDQVTRAFREE